MYAVIDQNRALTAMLEELRPPQPEAEGALSTGVLMNGEGASETTAPKCT